MDPIVSPWIIYGIEMLGALQSALEGIVAVAAVAEIFMLLCSASSDCVKEERDICRRYLWVPTVALVISAPLLVLLPSKETGYKMLAASYVTTDNIKAVGGATNEAIDSILDNVVKHMNEVKK